MFLFFNVGLLMILIKAYTHVVKQLWPFLAGDFPCLHICCTSTNMRNIVQANRCRLRQCATNGPDGLLCPYALFILTHPIFKHLLHDGIHGEPFPCCPMVAMTGEQRVLA